MNIQQVLRPYLLLVISLFSFFGLSSQVISTDMKAIGHNGKLAISVKNAGLINTYFSLDTNKQTSLEVYFNPDDPRNGIYEAGLLSQAASDTIITFNELLYETGDTLTFTVIETFNDGTVKPYVFIRGNYILGAGGLIDACPISITCNANWLYIAFNPSEYVVGQGINDISIFAPGLLQNGPLYAGGYNLEKNLFRIANQLFIGFDCQKIMTGQVILVINGMTCVFQNGALVESDHCSPWGNYYGQHLECAGYFENCMPELIHLLSDNSLTLACKQWIDKGSCSTSKTIYRNGKIAIGTDRFSAAALTVKNGIITDKVKVLFEGNGWGDYVFEKGYPLMPLEAVEAYISTYSHLPGTPSGEEIMNEGSFELGTVMLNHQVKIEEIFLHLIKLEEETALLEALLAMQKIKSGVQYK